MSFIPVTPATDRTEGNLQFLSKVVTPVRNHSETEEEEEEEEETDAKLHCDSFLSFYTNNLKSSVLCWNLS